MTSLRILHVYRTYYPDPTGGLQEAIRQIATASALLNIESRVFTLSPLPIPAEIKRPEAFVFRCRSWASPASCDIGGLSAIKKFSECTNWADIIHYHFPWPFADLLHLIVRPKKPAIITYHSDIIKKQLLGLGYIYFSRWMLQSMTAIVATSPAYARTSSVLQNPNIRNRVRVIPLGIDENTYPQQANEGVIQRLFLDDDEPFFLFIGVLRHYKGLHTLLQASNSVNARIVIAGSGSEEVNLKKQALQLNLKNVIFAGQISDAEKVALLNRCRALVLPSQLRSEAFGMVLVEASMFGKPMICCEINTGTSFVNIDGETGLVVPPESPVNLASAINLLATDHALALKYGNAARARYEKLFSAKALGQAYSDLYREVLKSQ